MLLTNKINFPNKVIYIWLVTKNKLLQTKFVSVDKKNREKKENKCNFSGEKERVKKIDFFFIISLLSLNHVVTKKRDHFFLWLIDETPEILTRHQEKRGRPGNQTINQTINQTRIQGPRTKPNQTRPVREIPETK